MNIYSISNKKYNINFDLKLDSFYIFIESLKESRKYYYDYCNLENINIKDFNNEYIDNINILKSDLLKYYILITNDDDVEKYVTIDDIIRDLYAFMISENPRSGSFEGINRDNDITEADSYLIKSININFLTRNQLSDLIIIYAYNSVRYENFKKGFLSKMNIINNTEQLYESLDKYLNSLKSESIYVRELVKILTNLPYICLSNISSKKILNCRNDNDINLIELDNNEEYIAVD